MDKGVILNVPASSCMYEITRDGDRWTVEGVIRGMKAGENEVVELGRFSISPAV